VSARSLGSTRLSWWLTLIPLVAGLVLAVLPARDSLGAASSPHVAFTYWELKNGLRVLISEDHSAPVFSVAVMYNVGSRDEQPGRTGFAHLFEHLMFKGSENVGAGEHFFTVFSNGGRMNGTTNKERTLYFETLPANQLDLALFLEADRMRSLDVVKTNLDNQRSAVEEERRQSLDNQPYGMTSEVIDQLALDNPAYRHSVIGSMDDLNAASLDEARAFYKTYYAPNNAYLAIAGDVSTDAALECVRNYFEAIPAQPLPPPVDITEPPQGGERRHTIADPLARLPRLDISFRIPSILSPDNDAVEVLALLLSGGRSSRFFESLVRDQQLAVSTTAFAPDSRGPRLFRLSFTTTTAESLAPLEAAVYKELDRIKSAPIADWEMTKARNAVRQRIVADVGSSLTRATNLAWYALAYGNPGLINTRYERTAAVRPADLARIVTQYFVPENRSVIITVPASRGGPTQTN
jgi:zinc protease